MTRHDGHEQIKNNTPDHIISHDNDNLVFMPEKELNCGGGGGGDDQPTPLPLRENVPEGDQLFFLQMAKDP